MLRPMHAELDKTRDVPPGGDLAQTGPDFSAVPSPPRARRPWRLMLWLLLLVLACCAIWWIDRGVALSNGHP
jgi:hypothetical protein